MAANPNTDPFAASGGGTYVNGGWIPNNNPGAIAAAKAAEAAAGGTPTSPAAPADPTKAPPNPYTSTAGSQADWWNAIQKRANQGTTVDTSAPEFRQQVEPYAAAQERMRRQTETEAAERAGAKGLASSGALDLSRRAAQERAGQATGEFESQLVGRELQNRRNEIAQALATMGSTISGDQARMLQKQLADLDAAIQRERISSSERLGQADIGLRGELGRGGLSLDALRMLLQNKQFGQNLGFQIGATEADLNNAALRYLFG